MIERSVSTVDTDSGALAQRVIPAPEAVATERFLADLKEFGADLERLMGQARSLTGDGAAVARDRFERVVTKAQSSIGAARENAVDRAHVARERAERYVRDEPWKAVAIAAATGVLLALLLSRR
jgi:ElaB/YqjD/DUF883 family membrane-anchored ribosome-binding protein